MKYKIFIILFFCSTAVFSQGIFEKLDLRIESGSYFKEFREDIFSKISVSYPLVQKEGWQSRIYLGGGFEVVGHDTKWLTPIYVSMETDRVCIIAGGEFVNESWCSLALGEICIWEGLRINGGVRIGDFNELILGLCYNL